MKSIIKFLAVATFLTVSTINNAISDNIITMSLLKYPYLKLSNKDPQFLEKLSKKLKQPGYLSSKPKKHLKNKAVPGVMAIYAGQVTLSNDNGQIIFPRLQQKPLVNILISKGIKPAYIIAPSTVHNWMIDTAHSSIMYIMQLKQDPTTQLYYFETNLAPLPKDNNIPLETIIIIANPTDIFVPEGATLTDFSPNLTLPPIFIKREFCFIFNSLATLAIKQYFTQTASTFQTENQTVSMIQQNSN